MYVSSRWFCSYLRFSTQLAYGAGTSAAVYGYGLYFTRPKWNAWSLRLASVAAFIAGSTYGTFRQFLVHYQFANSLENPQGFIAALNHVDEKLGGGGQVGFGFKELLAKKPEIKPDVDHTDHPRDADTFSEAGRIRDEGSTGESSFVIVLVDKNNNVVMKADSDPPRLRTRWDEIRAANSRSTSQSSWDTIRQRHERDRLFSTSNDSSSTTSTEAHERAAAQAQFDALLEAERRRG